MAVDQVEVQDWRRTELARWVPLWHVLLLLALVLVVVLIYHEFIPTI